MKKIISITVAFMFLAGLAFGQGDSAKVKTTPAKEKKVEKTMAKKYEKRKADNPEIAIETDFGTMKAELYHDVAPVTVDSLLSLMRKGFYNGLIFHRIIDNFMIQGGDPSGNGTGGPGFQLKAEFSSLKHVEGTLSMARAQDINSAGSQFFICLAPTPHLDGQYTIFGQLEDGYDVLHKIGKVKVRAGDNKPLQDVFIRKIVILKDWPPKKAAN